VLQRPPAVGSAWTAKAAGSITCSIERLWRGVKYEEFYLRAYASGANARAVLDPVLRVLQRTTLAREPRLRGRPDEVVTFGLRLAQTRTQPPESRHDRPCVCQLDCRGYRVAGVPRDRRSCSVIRGRFFIQKPKNRNRSFSALRARDTPPASRDNRQKSTCDLVRERSAPHHLRWLYPRRRSTCAG